MDKMDLINSDVTLHEVLEWLQTEIEEGNFPQFKSKTDDEFFTLVKVDIIIHMNHIAIMKNHKYLKDFKVH